MLHCELYQIVIVFLASDRWLPA